MLTFYRRMICADTGPGASKVKSLMGYRTPDKLDKQYLVRMKLDGKPFVCRLDIAIRCGLCNPKDFVKILRAEACSCEAKQCERVQACLHAHICKSMAGALAKNRKSMAGAQRRRREYCTLESPNQIYNACTPLICELLSLACSRT